MFEHFTFAAQALTTDQPEISASPTDTSFPSPVSHPSPSPSPGNPYPRYNTVDGIAHKLSQQSIRPADDAVPQKSLWCDRDDGRIPSPDLDDLEFDFTVEEMTYVSTRHGMLTISVPSPSTQSLPDLPSPPPPRGGAVACRRLQRQLNVQLQASSSHIRDINALVEDMIVTNSQCNLRTTTSRPNLSSAVPSRAGMDESVIDTSEGDATQFQPQGRPVSAMEDEGFSEISDEDWGIEEEMTLRRASTPNGIRKFGMIRYRVSSDGAGDVNGYARTKVRSLPRMRRRKPTSVPE